MTNTLALTLSARRWGLSGQGMHWLLLSLWLVGAVVYSSHAYSSHAPSLLRTPKPETALSEEPVVGTSSPAASRANTLQPDNAAPMRGVTEIAKTPAPAVSERTKTPAPLPSSKTTEPSQLSGSEGQDAAAGWVEVARAARVHTGPSVSSPTVRFYPVGIDLQLVGHEEGWFQVLDSTTAERGWIYEKYLEAIRSPSHAGPQEVQGPVLTASATPALAQPIAKPKKQQLAKAKKQQQDLFESTPPSSTREVTYWQAQPVRSPRSWQRPEQRYVHGENPSWADVLFR